MCAKCSSETWVSNMSAPSSSGSWSGGGCAGAPDIIDLDKFMRGAVRPSRRHDGETRSTRCGQLVVDAGGVERKIAAMAPLVGAGAAPTVPGPPALPPGGPPVTVEGEISSSSVSTRPPHAKRFSHDSGLSDGSYARRKHRPHRRAAAGEVSRNPNGVYRSGGGSTSSLRAFRAVCERTLLDQQAQIARVAQLCERLTERHPTPPPTRPPPSPHKSETTTARSSDITSTSLSTRTRDPRRKDRHRTEECKTYKIIMNKLDELNRLFAKRSTSPPARPALPPRRPIPSSGSVSVSDKIVSTEPALLVVACESGPVSACDPRCGFDLQDPIHIYMQAKRLHGLPTTARRARSVEPALDGRYSERLGPHVSEPVRREPRAISLCALCRGCWRSFRQYLATQIFSSAEGGGQ